MTGQLDPPEVQVARINRGGTVRAAAITAAASLIVGFVSGREIGQPSPDPEPTRPPAVVKIRQPLPGHEVSYCTDVSGSLADIPPGKTLVIANLEKGGDRYYFEPEVQRDAGDWSSRIYLGEPGDEAVVGREFTIYVLLVDRKVAAYLGATEVHGKNFWSSPVTLGWPPTAEEKQQIMVKRSREEACQ